MGFRLNRTYVLEFEGSMAGAEIKLRTTSAGTVVRLREASTAADLAGLLAEHVIEWNLDDEKGEPLAITADAILSELEEPIIAAIAKQWFMAATGVTAPLDAGSISGEPSLAESIPMDNA